MKLAEFFLNYTEYNHLFNFSDKTALLDWTFLHGTPKLVKILLRRNYQINFPQVTLPMMLKQEKIPMFKLLTQTQQNLHGIALKFLKSDYTLTNSQFENDFRQFLKSPQSLKSLCRMQIDKFSHYESEILPTQLVRFLEFQFD